MPDSITDSAPALDFRAVSKRYGTTPALTDFTLQIPRGTVFGLVGGNGAGKTTLIKCLLDFCALDEGAIRLFGLGHRLTASRARLVFLPERFNAPFYLSGRDFMRYMAQMHRTAYDEERVRETFARLDLASDALSKPVRAYSKGMTQKLGLAACFASGKPLQVLDEPTSGLDPKARALLKRELLARRDAGATIFLTSHALADVEEICDRMAVLHGGRLRFGGSPAELVSRYRASDLESAFLECIAEPLVA